MPGLPKGYIQKYGSMKAAWKAYKAEGGGGGGGAKHRKGKSHKGGGVVLHNVVNHSSAVARFSRSSYAQNTLSALKDTAIGLGGAGITTLFVNYTPYIKDTSKTARAGIQMGIGTAMLLLPWRWVKIAGGSNMLLGGASLLQLLFKYNVMAGPGRELTAAEYATVTKGILNGPVRVMNGPVRVMNGPVRVMDGSAFQPGEDIWGASKNWEEHSTWNDEMG